MSDANYAQVLSQYIEDVQSNEEMQKEMKRVHMAEMAYSSSMFDYIFPFHMILGRFETEESVDLHGQETEEGVNVSPLKAFVRRRNMLVLMHSHKMDKVFTQEEKDEMRHLLDF